MAVSPNLKRLVAANAPLWAGEAEVVRSYWTSPKRTRATDKLWLKRQCWKEFAGTADLKGDTVALLSGLAAIIKQQLPSLDVSVDRHDLRDEVETAFVEYTHYCHFADVYDTLLDPGEPKLNANKLETWPEEDRLASRRREVRRTIGKIGTRASSFTEGGYCTMYSEGAKLKGRPGLDGRIGAACQKVYDDEFGHMMRGVIGIDEEGLSESEWEQMAQLTTEQLRMRILMRNAQFSHPLSDERVSEILAGKIEPIAFDFARAETYLAHAAE
ncbi:MAG: hypothetical protein ACREFQ_10150 [Stellaceae bacterium]